MSRLRGGGQAQQPGNAIGEKAANDDCQIAGQNQAGVEVQVEGRSADLPDEKRRERNVIGGVADFIEEKFIDKIDAPDPETKGNDEENGKNDIQKTHKSHPWKPYVSPCSLNSWCLQGYAKKS